MSYKVVSYTQKELDYFYGITRAMESEEGRRIPIDELIDKTIINKDNDLIFFLHYMQIMQRSMIIEDKLKHTNFNFREGKDVYPNYSKEEVDQFEETLNQYWKDGILDTYETIDKAIENKNFKLINYLNYLEIIREEHIIETKIAKQIMKDMKEKDKHVKNYVKKILKGLPEFKEVSSRKDCDVLLIIDENNLSNYHKVYNEEGNEEIKKAIESGRYKIFYLKNCNPRDRKKASYGFVKNLKPGRDFTK